MNMNSKKWHDWLLMANAIEFHGGDTFLAPNYSGPEWSNALQCQKRAANRKTSQQQNQTCIYSIM